MSAVTVSGIMVYSQVILQATTLTFDSGSTLLLAPTQDKGGGPPTTLTIIANEIDITLSNSKVTAAAWILPGVLSASLTARS